MPSPAVLSLVALLAVIVISTTSRINPGLVAMGLAWGIGVYAGGVTVDAVLGGFPSALFLTLVGVTLLFSLAQANGTLEILTQHAVRLCRGNPILLPPLFFALACLVSAIGPAAVAGVALVAPLAIPVGVRTGVGSFLTAVMVGTGANAGNLSPVSYVGVLANSLMAEIGLPGQQWKVWAAGFVAHALVALGAYVVLGIRHSAPRHSASHGSRLGVGPGARRRRAGTFGAFSPPAWGGAAELPSAELPTPEPLLRRHWITIGVVVAWVTAVVGWGVHIGMSAVVAATLLVLVAAADERAGLRGMPWGVIIMISGVTLLISLLERTGGLELFTAILARLASPATLNGTIAFVTGVVSTYSSTSGVVLPAFLPTVPGLVREVGGGDPLAVALSITVGSALVDVSPLSTIGALCVAAVPSHEEARDLFRKLLLWGLSMTVVGAILAQICAEPLARM